MAKFINNINGFVEESIETLQQLLSTVVENDNEPVYLIHRPLAMVSNTAVYLSAAPTEDIIDVREFGHTGVLFNVKNPRSHASAVGIKLSNGFTDNALSRLDTSSLVSITLLKGIPEPINDGLSVEINVGPDDELIPMLNDARMKTRAKVINVYCDHPLAFDYTDAGWGIVDREDIIEIVSSFVVGKGQVLTFRWAVCEE